MQYESSPLLAPPPSPPPSLPRAPRAAHLCPLQGNGQELGKDGGGGAGEGAELDKRSGAGRTMINLCKSFVGAGVLGLPHAIAQGGAVGGTVVLLLVALISWYGSQQVLLIKEQYGCNTYAEVGGLAFGGRLRLCGTRFVELVVVVCQVGFASAYLLVITTTCQALWPHPMTGTATLCGCVVVLVPAVLLRSFRSLAPLSLLTLAVFSLGALSTLGYGVAYANSYGREAFIEDHSGGAQTEGQGLHGMRLVSVGGIGQCFGEAVFTFESVNLISPIHSNARYKGNIFLWHVKSAFAAMTIVFVGFSLPCYIFFGEKTESIVTLNLPAHSPVATLVKLAFAAVSLLTFPISMFPVAAIVDGWSGGGAGRRRRQGDGVRVGLLVVVAVLTYTVPDFSLLLSIFGCTANSLAGFMLPSIFALRLLPRTGTRQAACVAVVLLGAAAMTIGTWQTWAHATRGGRGGG